MPAIAALMYTPPITLLQQARQQAPRDLALGSPVKVGGTMHYPEGLGREAHRRQTTKRFPVCVYASMWPYYPPVPPLEQSRLGPFGAVAGSLPPGPGSPLACDFWSLAVGLAILGTFVSFLRVCGWGAFSW